MIILEMPTNEQNLLVSRCGNPPFFPKKVPETRTDVALQGADFFCSASGLIGVSPGNGSLPT